MASKGALTFQTKKNVYQGTGVSVSLPRRWMVTPRMNGSWRTSTGRETMYVYAYVYVHVYVCVCVCVYLFRCVCVCVCVCSRPSTNTHTHLACMHAYTYTTYMLGQVLLTEVNSAGEGCISTHTHTHTHTHTQHI